MLCLFFGGVDWQFALSSPIQPEAPARLRYYFIDFVPAPRVCKSFRKLQLQSTSEMYQNKGFRVAINPFVLIHLCKMPDLRANKCRRIIHLRNMPPRCPGVGGTPFLFYPRSSTVSLELHPNCPLRRSSPMAENEMPHLLAKPLAQLL